MTFLDQKKARCYCYKAEMSHRGTAARQNGFYRGRPRSFCLPQECAEENLYAGIRGATNSASYRAGIPWHDGRDGKPSNHRCRSQADESVPKMGQRARSVAPGCWVARGWEATRGRLRGWSTPVR